MLQDHHDLCVGIDLGTTNSVLATINITPGGSVVSKVVDIGRFVDMYTPPSGAESFKGTSERKALLPSYVFYRDTRSGELKPVVGDFAKRQYSIRPQLVSRSIKSQMGQTGVSGLDPRVPDRKPEEVSAQILKHLLGEFKKTYHLDITDAVITVPASFDAAMCLATLKAAQIAGIRTENQDGTKRQVLLSEPNAVMYDLLNQIQRGEISSHILDTAKKQRVLVFDIGGGTLDITLHEISRNEKNPELMQMDEIATNRYTRLGGDDFDELLAQELFRRYRKQYQNNQDIISKIEKSKNEVMPHMITFAENLKIDINNQVCNTQDNPWGQDNTWGDEEIIGDVGGRMYNGYNYNDAFSKEDFEKIVAPFMGEDLQFSDYRRFEEITDESSINTIIYPILEVLHKGADKLKTGDIGVDAVVLNGGMSKLYLIQNRLEAFFGFKPIIALDPDKSVARGAAVYHHYLHKYGESEAALPVNLQSTQERGIHLRKTVLNESLYLGMSGGSHELLLGVGADLPFTSPEISGYSIAPHQSKIKIPLRKQDPKGGFITIASGEISFEKPYREGAAVSICFSISRNKILSFTANTEQESGSTTIYIDKGLTAGSSMGVMPPQGAKLVPVNELSTLMNLCRRRKQDHRGINTHKIIKSRIKTIMHCGNPEGFALPIMAELDKQLKQTNRDEFFIQRLLVLVRRLAAYWGTEEKAQVVDQALTIASFINNSFIPISGDRVATINEAIRNIGLLGNGKQQTKLLSFHAGDKRFDEALVYAHAVSQTEIPWIYQRLSQDSGISIWGIGVALQRNGKAGASVKPQDAVNKLLTMLDAHKLNTNHRDAALLSIGIICDQRHTAVDPVSGAYALQAAEHIEDSLQYYSQSKQLHIALQLCKGELLSEEDEKYLLQKITDTDDE